MKLGYCPVGNGSSIAPFDALFEDKVDISKSIEGVDAVVFWGGTDIHPSLYNEELNIHSQASKSGPSKRDLFEWQAMNYCKLNKIPMIGVCRGAQLMTAFVGGTLIQHVNGHHNEHTMTTDQGEVLSTTSCHHQMMYPFGVEHKMLAWSTQSRSTVYLNGENKSIDKMYLKGVVEPEVVYYPQVRGLAIQGHPEWALNTPFAEYCNGLIEELLIPSMVS
jgi:gamma-glutamyl-gamma-aminobutyrate hydrolase PuuD